MGAPEFLDRSLTPSALLALCEGWTDLALKDATARYVGKWILFRGRLKIMTEPGPIVPDVIANATVTTADSADVFCAFSKYSEYLSDLKSIGVDDLIIVTGEIAEIRRHQLSLKHCSVSSVIPKKIADLTDRWQREKEEKEATEAKEVTEAEDARPQPAVPDLVESPLPKPRLKALSVAEQTRFAQLYLGIWGAAAVEGKALEAIRATYPENSIGRDAFYKIFRELRGPGKRGNPSFRGD